MLNYELLYRHARGDVDLFLEYIDEWNWFNDIFLQKIEDNWKIRNTTTQFKAFQIFKDQMPSYLKIKELYEPETDIRQLKQWMNLDNTDTLAAKEITMQEIIDREGIKNYRRRAACPLCESGNGTTLSFKDKVFCCFKCGEKGDTITFVQKLHYLNFKESINYLTSN